jgi:hypothetical protein
VTSGIQPPYPAVLYRVLRGLIGSEATHIEVKLIKRVVAPDRSLPFLNFNSKGVVDIVQVQRGLDTTFHSRSFAVNTRFGSIDESWTAETAGPSALWTPQRARQEALRLTHARDIQHGRCNFTNLTARSECN